MPTLIANTKYVRRTSLLGNEAPGYSMTEAGLNGAVNSDVSPARKRDQLILQNMGIVRMVARRIYERMPQHLDIEELVSAGLLGLIDAASKYDFSKQVQFQSYAQFRIRGAILDSLRTLDWSPRELRRKGRVMAEAIRALSAELGRTPTDEEISSAMGMTLIDFQQMTGELSTLKVESLNEERSEEVGDEEIEHLPAPASENPLAVLVQGQTREQLSTAIEVLPEKERLVLTLYYYEEMTLREVGAALGVGESRVSQIRTTALARLKRALERPKQGRNSRNRGLRH
jgi:RNA polymerase sigma factor FliA